MIFFPALPLPWPSFPNVCSYGQKKPDMAKLFEITSEKKVVWEFIHPKARAHEVHILTTNGKPEGALK